MYLPENLKSQMRLAVYFHWTVLGSRCWSGAGELGHIVQNGARLEGGNHVQGSSPHQGARNNIYVRF